MFRATGIAMLLLILLAGCGDTAATSSQGAATTRGAPPVIRLATTTSTRDSGLLDHLAPLLEKDTGIRWEVVAVGSGRALALGRDGDADLLMTHAPDGEKELVAQGVAVERRPFMYNDFLIVGPPSDPAGVRGLERVGEALLRIRDTGVPFLSRGDDSGTHRRELALWRDAGVEDPSFKGYREVGRGMGATLAMAAEMEAYTLTDRSTRLKHADRERLPILVEGDPPLRNPYAVLLLDGTRFPHLHHEEARRVADWLTGPAGRAAISSYRLEGQQVFFVLDRAE